MAWACPWTLGWCHKEAGAWEEPYPLISTGKKTCMSVFIHVLMFIVYSEFSAVTHEALISAVQFKCLYLISLFRCQKRHSFRKKNPHVQSVTPVQSRDTGGADGFVISHLALICCCVCLFFCHICKTAKPAVLILPALADLKRRHGFTLLTLSRPATMKPKALGFPSRQKCVMSTNTGRTVGPAMADVQAAKVRTKRELLFFFSFFFPSSMQFRSSIALWTPFKLAMRFAVNTEALHPPQPQHTLDYGSWFLNNK